MVGRNDHSMALDKISETKLICQKTCKKLSTFSLIPVIKIESGLAKMVIRNLIRPNMAARGRSLSQ